MSQNVYSSVEYLILSSKTRMIKINLNDFIMSPPIENVWRLRICSMVVFLMDEQEKIIANRQTDKFSVYIEFPSTFHDFDRNNEPQMFATTSPKYCSPGYQGDGGVSSRCTGGSESIRDLLSASPNGRFVFTLTDKKNLNMTLLHSLMISIGGTFSNFD